MTTGSYKNRNHEVRQAEAIVRQDLRNKRTPMEQLRLLDARLGAGKGAAKERARLEAVILAEMEEIKRLAQKKEKKKQKKKK